MNWPPQLSEHPAYNTLERKCRRLMGLASNERERLAEDGVDLQPEHDWAYAEFRRTNDLEERAATDSTARAQLAAEQLRLDPILHARFKALVDLVARYHPGSGSLRQARLYLLRWDTCVGEPRLPLPADCDTHDDSDHEDMDALWSTPVYGIPWEKLTAACQAIFDLNIKDDPANRYLAAWTLFLCGLVHGMNHKVQTGQAAVHPYDDGLPQAARESWEEGVDFALTDQSRELAARHSEQFAQPAVGQMFLAVARASCWVPPDVQVWLTQWNESDAKLRLLVALGVRAATEHYGGRLFKSITDAEQLMEYLHIEPRLLRIVAAFLPGDEAE